MKTLVNLTAQSVEGSWAEPRGHISVLHCEVSPGCFLNVSLGQAGLCIFAGDTKVGIPASELVRMAQAHEPDLKPRTETPAISEAAAARARLAEKARLKAAARAPAPPPEAATL